YRKVRRMQLENRVVPLVGDLAGTGALPRLADELRRRSLPVRVFYVSNVEQYLFTSAKTWAQWIRNVRTLPWADDGLLLRVYFDQGRAHPRQRPGHRTTSLTQPTSAFLARADQGGWKSWWEVTQLGSITLDVQVIGGIEHEVRARGGHDRIPPCGAGDSIGRAPCIPGAEPLGEQPGRD
ncbi:MAG: hypothetical protein RMJ98_05180, partial [Myxococcales bacterium]|nr:hypothetical protein [Polyangiaceae bacterium]MDW8248682.1 hypothetical protein [Myxococcales bacterium]